MTRGLSRPIRCAAVAVVSLVLASCSKNADVERPPEAGQVLALSESAGAAALDQRFAMQKGDVTYGEDGSLKGGKRSQFEGQRNVAFGGNWGGKSFGKKSFGTSAWNGGGQLAQKNFNTGESGKFRSSSSYGGRQSVQAGQRSSYDGKNRVTSTLGTGVATEASRASLSKPVDAKAAWRRSVYPQPRIETLADAQRRNVEETRSLLGRSD